MGPQLDPAAAAERRSRGCECYAWHLQQMVRLKDGDIHRQKHRETERDETPTVSNSEHLTERAMERATDGKREGGVRGEDEKGFCPCVEGLVRHDEIRPSGLKGGAGHATKAVAVEAEPAKIGAVQGLWILRGAAPHPLCSRRHVRRCGRRLHARDLVAEEKEKHRRAHRERGASWADAVHRGARIALGARAALREGGPSAEGDAEKAEPQLAQDGDVEVGRPREEVAYPEGNAPRRAHQAA